MTETLPTPRYPVFVVGMPRSGTTLLSRLLDAHPKLAMAPETHYFTRCWTGEPVTTSADAMRMLDRLYQQPGVQDLNFSEAEQAAIREKIQQHAPSHATVLRAMIETFAARTGAPAWGEKTPDHLRFVSQMARAFPDAVFIAIVRDPRDVVLSLRAMPWNRSTLPEQAWTWRSYAARIARYHAAFPERFTSIRYEDLITDPEQHLRALCAFLKTDFHPAMIGERAPDTDVVDADREPWKRKSIRPIDPTNQGKWCTQMPEAERVIVEALAGRYLTAYGYARAPVDWRPVLVGQVVQRLVRAGCVWGRRRLRRLRFRGPGPGDARPRWMIGDGTDETAS